MSNWTLGARAGAKALLLGGAAMATVSQADAALFTVTWEGTLDYGWYYASASDPGTDLTGRGFKVVYTIDDSKGINGSGLNIAQVYGGSIYGVSSPVSSVFTIDGLGPYSVMGDYQSNAFRTDYDPGIGQDQDYQFANDYQFSNDLGGAGNVLWQDEKYRYSYSYNYESDPTSYGTLFDSLEFDSSPARGFLLSDQRYHAFYDYDYRYDYMTSTYDRYTYLYAYSYNGSWVSPPPPPAVPEPATWAMMIAGLGTVGYAMRRRRVRTAFA